MRRLFFNLQYALRNIRRGGRWSVLAILCIAAGVATIVALRGLGLAIGESLSSNVREQNRGDVLLVRDRGGETFFTLLVGSENTVSFTQNEINAVNAYVAERGGTVAEYVSGGSIQVVGIDSGVFGGASLITSYVIDPQSYPPTHNVLALEPPGVPLEQLFGDGAEVVISQNMAEAQELGLGDELRLSGTDQPFTITGIVPTEQEASLRNLFSAYFGFLYIDIEDARRHIDEGLQPNRMAVAFDTPLTASNAEPVRRDLVALASQDSPFTDSDTAQAQLERNQVIAQILGDFIVVLGLGALLIGGVGIMNTMLVLVRRRTNEIAALKTFGLKGRQIAALFFTEGLVLGLIGSVLGSIVGLLLGAFVTEYGERFLQQSLQWRVYPEALGYGFVLGLLVTSIFSLVPILTALEVRPGVILRPNENTVPRLGILQALFLMTIITVLLGLITGQIVRPTFGLLPSIPVGNNPYAWGVAAVTIALVILALLTVFFWIVLWIIGKIPTFGFVELRLALRNMSARRWRTATTLLALTAGMFVLSGITFVGEGTRELLNQQLSRNFGGNVIAFALVPPSNDALLNTARRQQANALADVPGVESQTVLGIEDLNLVAINGQRFDSEVVFEDISPLDPAALAPQVWQNVTIWDSDNPAIYNDLVNIVRGRNLTPEDRGRLVMTGPIDYALPLGIDVGSILRYELASESVEIEVVGLYDAGQQFLLANSAMMTPDSLPGNLDFRFFTYQVQPEFVGQAVAELSAIRIPPTFALDIALVDTLVSNVIAQFSAIPTVVAVLSLIAAAVIMANTVALSTLERRRQIGILKSVGLKGHRVLRIMLIEALLVTLLSALLGIGLSWVFVEFFERLTNAYLPVPREAQIIAALLVAIAVFIGVAATVFSAGVAIRERVMNVLRYD